MQRLTSTVRDHGTKAHRIADILSAPFKGRHMTNFVKGSRLVDGQPVFDAMAYWGILQHGLRISEGAQTAIHGDGAYCFSLVKPPAWDWAFYVDVQIPPNGVGIEQIAVPGQPIFYRFLPAEGSFIRGVKILDTNIPVGALEMARKLQS